MFLAFCLSFLRPSDIPAALPGPTGTPALPSNLPPPARQSPSLATGPGDRFYSIDQ
jgi:hypothetical protein